MRLPNAKHLSEFKQTGETRPPQPGDWFESRSTPGYALLKLTDMAIGPRAIVQPCDGFGRVNGDGVLASAAIGRLIEHFRAEKHRVDRELLQLGDEQARIHADIAQLRDAQRVAEASESR